MSSVELRIMAAIFSMDPRNRAVILEAADKIDRLRAELAEAKAVLQMIDAHYSASLDWQPSYVRHARAVLAALSGGEGA